MRAIEADKPEPRVLVGKYRLEVILGSGGMGDVWRARRLSDQAEVAIKLMKAIHTSDAIVVTRFLREARAARMVRHPNVVEVLDVGQAEGGAPFIVQELLVGDDLSRTLKSIGGKLRADVALDLMIPVARAVASVHESGVVHRDLKPGNIFLARIDKKTTPKLLDFGVSQFSDSSEASRLTTTGVSMGTPAYMSPEQVMASKDLDARCDVWALGVILYEMVAGRLPFTKGDTPGALYVQICTMDPPPLRDFAPQVPDSYERVVVRCLRRDRTQRYATARELVADLEAAQGGKELSASARAIAMAPPALTTAPGSEAPAADDPLDDFARGPRPAIASIPPPPSHTRPSGPAEALAVPDEPFGSEASASLVGASGAAGPPAIELAREPDSSPRPGTRSGSIELAAEPVRRRMLAPGQAIPTPPRAVASERSRDRAVPPRPLDVVLAAVAAAMAVVLPWAGPHAPSWMPRVPFALMAAVAVAIALLASLRGVRGYRISVGLLVVAAAYLALALCAAVWAWLARDFPTLAPAVAPWAALAAAAGSAVAPVAEVWRAARAKRLELAALAVFGVLAGAGATALAGWAAWRLLIAE